MTIFLKKIGGETMARIHVEEEGLTALAQALDTAGESYKAQLSKLTDLVAQITSGTIQGDLANSIKAKFDEKRDSLEGMQKTIDEAKDYMQQMGVSFNRMVSDVQQGMR